MYVADFPFVQSRHQEYSQLAVAPNLLSPESRLMCHLYNNLGGEKAQCHVTLRDNLIIDN